MRCVVESVGPGVDYGARGVGWRQVRRVKTYRTYVEINGFLKNLQSSTILSSEHTGNAYRLQSYFRHADDLYDNWSWSNSTRR